MKDYIYSCDLDRVVDGDTVDLVVDLGFNISKKIRVRLAHFDAPEPRGETRQAGERFRRWVQLWFESHIRDDIFVETRKTGKYGRWVGDVFVTDQGGHAWDAPPQSGRLYLHDYLKEKE